MTAPTPEQPNLALSLDTLDAVAEVMAGRLTTAELGELLGADLATGTLGVVHTLLTLLALKAGMSPEQTMGLARDVLTQALAKVAAA